MGNKIEAVVSDSVNEVLNEAAQTKGVPVSALVTSILSGWAFHSEMLNKAGNEADSMSKRLSE